MQVSPELLNETTLLGGLPVDLLREICTISVLHRHVKGDILYYEKDRQKKILFLIDGLIKVYKVDRFDNELFLYNLYKDTLISDITDFDAIACFANAEFAADSLVLEIDHDPFRGIYENNAALLLRLIKEFTKKSNMYKCIINREIVFDGTAKVAFMLMQDIDTFNAFKKQEIASMLNIQPETLSRILKKMLRKALIENVDGRIVIRDAQSLRAIFEG